MKNILGWYKYIVSYRFKNARKVRIFGAIVMSTAIWLGVYWFGVKMGVVMILALFGSNLEGKFR
jgi:hypothetical protein